MHMGPEAVCYVRRERVQEILGDQRVQDAAKRDRQQREREAQPSTGPQPSSSKADSALPAHASNGVAKPLPASNGAQAASNGAQAASNGAQPAAEASNGVDACLCCLHVLCAEHCCVLRQSVHGGKSCTVAQVAWLHALGCER